VDIERCVVLEDSPNGAASGNAAGALVVAVPQVVAVPAAPRRVQVTSLAGITPADLREMLDPAAG
jgi:beta-phosphoglucomutase-like phosphatase (HAD superfamily)